MQCPDLSFEFRHFTCPGSRRQRRKPRGRVGVQAWALKQAYLTSHRLRVCATGARARISFCHGPFLPTCRTTSRPPSYPHPDNAHRSRPRTTAAAHAARRAQPPCYSPQHAYCSACGYRRPGCPPGWPCCTTSSSRRPSECRARQHSVRTLELAEPALFRCGRRESAVRAFEIKALKNP